VSVVRKPMTCLKSNYSASVIISHVRWIECVFDWQ
jgi:hypothetical protein